LTESEPVTVSDKQVEATVSETAAAIRAVKSMVAFTEQMYSALATPGGTLTSARGVEARAAADAWLELLDTLQPQLLLLKRLEHRRAKGVDPPLLGPNPISPPPTLNGGSILEAPAKAKRQMEYAAEEMARHIPELKRALMVLHNCSASWSSHADRQLHADLGRHISRILNGVSLEELQESQAKRSEASK
jgi:hypothetical protein